MVTGGFSSSGCGGFFPLLSILVYFKTLVAERGHITPSTSHSAAGQGDTERGSWSYTHSQPGITAVHFA